MRIVLLVLLLCWAAIGYAADAKLTGIFSNEAEGFKIVTVIVHKDGLAYFHAAIGGQIGEWTFDQPSSTLSINLFGRSSTIQLKFNPQTRDYKLIKSAEAGSEERADTLKFLTDEIPEKMLAAFETYPETIKKVRAQTLAAKEWQTRQKAQLERERPEYDRVLAQIQRKPKSVLSKEFYTRDVTPTTRAFNASLQDTNIHYPEEVLIGLLEQLPEDNHWIRAAIFARPELQATALTKFYPKALLWGELNHTILSNIATHPNTPLEVVRDLAGRDNLPTGATNPAKSRLEKLEMKE